MSTLKQNNIVWGTVEWGLYFGKTWKLLYHHVYTFTYSIHNLWICFNIPLHQISYVRLHFFPHVSILLQYMLEMHVITPHAYCWVWNCMLLLHPSLFLIPTVALFMSSSNRCIASHLPLVICPQGGLLYWGTRNMRFLRDMQNVL